MSELTAKQRAFVREYLVDSCGSKAAVRAGYSPKGADVQAAHLLKRPAIAKAVAVGRNLAEDRCEVKADQILRELARIAFADARSLSAHHILPCPKCWEPARKDSEPNPACPLCEGQGMGSVRIADTRYLSPEASALFAGVKRTRDGVEIRAHDKLKALELLARCKGMLDKPEPVDPGALGGTVIVRFVPAAPAVKAP